MYYNIIKTYIDKLSKEDIINYSKKENINLTSHELDIIYNSIKNNWKDLYNGKEDILNVIKNEVSIEVYEKIISLYKNAKEKLLWFIIVYYCVF